MEIVTTIALLYQTLLGRQAEQAEIAFWAEKVKTDGIEATIDAIRQSTEAGLVVNKLAVIALYQSMLGRLPDIDGLNFFAAAVAEGSIKLQDFPQILAGSDEFKADNPGLPVPLSTQQIITLVYENLLGREPDSGGLTYFTNAVASGSLSFKDMLEAIATSDEFVDSRGDALQDYLLDIADGRIDDPKNTGSLGGEPTPTPPTNPTPPGGGGGGGEEPEPEVQTLTVAEARILGPYGEDYKLLDTLDNIFNADPLIVARAESYSLTNAQGGVGGITVAKAVVLEGAANQDNYDYSLTDSDGAIQAAPDTIKAEADTVSVIGTASGEVFNYQNFPVGSFNRGVILNGNGGTDAFFGSAGNDTINVGVNGFSAAGIFGGRGLDTINLGDGSLDIVALTKLSGSIGFAGEREFISSFEATDKILIDSDDVSAPQNQNPSYLGVATYDEINAINSSVDFNGEAVLEFTQEVHSRADLGAANDGSELIRGIYHQYAAVSIGLEADWEGFIVAYDNQKAYVYHAEVGSNGFLEASEASLIAVISPDAPYSTGFLSQANFTFSL